MIHVRTCAEMKLVLPRHAPLTGLGPRPRDRWRCAILARVPNIEPGTCIDAYVHVEGLYSEACVRARYSLGWVQSRATRVHHAAHRYAHAAPHALSDERRPSEQLLGPQASNAFLSSVSIAGCRASYDRKPWVQSVCLMGSVVEVLQHQTTRS